MLLRTRKAQGRNSEQSIKANWEIKRHKIADRSRPPLKIGQNLDKQKRHRSTQTLSSNGQEFLWSQELLMTIPKVALANFVNVAMIMSEMNVNIVDQIPVVLLQNEVRFWNKFWARKRVGNMPPSQKWEAHSFLQMWLFSQAEWQASDGGAMFCFNAKMSRIREAVKKQSKLGHLDQLAITPSPQFGTPPKDNSLALLGPFLSIS